MRLSRCLAVACAAVLSLPFTLSAEQSDLRTQFQNVLAKAYEQSDLFIAHLPPFEIKANATSYLALRSTGSGTFEEEEIRHGYWRRVIHFDDYASTELGLGAGQEWWTETSARSIRADQLFRLVMLHIPSPISLETYILDGSKSATEAGYAVTCYAAHRSSSDGFPRQYQWCFDRETGLLISEDLPLKTHVVFGGYIPFNSRQEYTEVHASVDGLPTLDIRISYLPISPTTLNGVLPAADMHLGQVRHLDDLATAGDARVLEKADALLPAGLRRPDVGQVVLRFTPSANGRIQDAAIESAPSLAIAQAALESAGGWRIISSDNDEKATRKSVYEEASFASSDLDAPAEDTLAASRQAAPVGPPMTLDQFRELVKALGLDTVEQNHLRAQLAQQKAQFPSWSPVEIEQEIGEKWAAVDLAAAYFPAYQKCYTAEDARLLIAISKLPEGYALIHPSLQLESREELAGKSPAQARADAMANEHGTSKQILNKLDLENRSYAISFYSHHRDRLLTACITSIAPAAEAEYSQQLGDVVKQVISAHQAEIQAARAKYDAEHHDPANP